MQNPLVSILVPVYNQRRYVRESLESVLAQTYPHFELIVMDDCSTDGSADEIEQVRDERIRFVRRPANSGLANIPRNEMIRMAQGEYVAFLDGDDTWMPEKLAKQVGFMAAHPEYPFSHVACMVVDENGRDLYVRNHGHYPSNGDCFVELMRKCFICTSTVMVRRGLLKEVGGFSEDRRLRNNGDDTDFFLRCARKGPVGMPSGEVLVKYRWDPNSLTHHPSRWRPGLDLLARRDLWEGRLSGRQVRTIVWETWDGKAYEWRGRGGFAQARWFAWQMICLLPFRAKGWRQLVASILRRP